jgi:hypothetical protein
VPPSKFKSEMLEESEIPRARASMNPCMFRKKYSKDSKKQVSMRNKIETIVSSVGSKHKTSTENEDSHSSHTICTEKHDASDYENPEKSEKDDRDHSDSISELDISDDQGQENGPADWLSGDESAPKEDESEIAESKVLDEVV